MKMCRALAAVKTAGTTDGLIAFTTVERNIWASEEREGEGQGVSRELLREAVLAARDVYLRRDESLI